MGTAPWSRRHQGAMDAKPPTNKAITITVATLSSVVDPHHIDADPDADPDPQHWVVQNS
jgi:hypothetical protein